MSAQEWPALAAVPELMTSHKLPERRDVEQVRARWRMDRMRYRRRVSQALDDLCVRMYGAEEAARYGIRDRTGRWAA
ncbi:hypothetical protein [Micromonospora globispora]|uniref:hypothetical protein n=1 Tax=Micromonospora globispora TaxID=1450148 RepID=UPI000F5F3552|nr:hypothetical protein [Micromonospora globispora]RQW83561.1 hypothetical protein DKL51_31550 [Micromonospora globispora]